MPFVWLDVGVAVIGCAVLALAALKVLRQVKALGREVSAAGSRIGAELAELERAAARPPAG